MYLEHSDMGSLAQGDVNAELYHKLELRNYSETCERRFDGRQFQAATELVMSPCLPRE